jgi:hypothetical protein
MKTKTKLLIIIGLIMLFENCTKDANCGDQSDIVNSYYISADDKSKIPFKGNDTLTYISDAGDTAILFGSGKREFIDQIRKNISGNADCPRSTVDNNETISIEYNGSNNELNKLGFKIYGNTENTKIQFLINSFYGNTDPYYFNNTTTYSDSVRIGNKFYIGKPIVWLGINTLLYNFNNGFLKIQLNGGKIWLLKI